MKIEVTEAIVALLYLITHAPGSASVVVVEKLYLNHHLSHCEP
jgi:hypothetical protein